MKQDGVKIQEESLPEAEMPLFDASAVENAQSVVPFREIQGENDARAGSPHSPRVGINRFKSRFTPRMVFALTAAVIVFGLVAAMLYSPSAERNIIAPAAADTAITKNDAETVKPEASRNISAPEKSSISPLNQEYPFVSQTKRSWRGGRSSGNSRNVPDYAGVEARRELFEREDDEDEREDEGKRKRGRKREWDDDDFVRQIKRAKSDFRHFKRILRGEDDN